MKGYKITKENMHKLSDPFREEFMPRASIMQIFGDLKGKILADVGCGTGYYSLDFSNLVGEEGKVFSIDVNEELLEQVIYKTKDLHNVINVLSSENRIPVDTDVADIAVSINTFHEFDQELTLNEIRRILKNEGYLYIIDWSPEHTPPPGPPVDHRILIEDVKLICDDLGFNYIDAFSISPYHYALRFENKK